MNTAESVPYGPLPEIAPDIVTLLMKVKLFNAPVIGNAAAVRFTEVGYCVNVPGLIPTCAAEDKSCAVTKY